MRVVDWYGILKKDNGITFYDEINEKHFLALVLVKCETCNTYFIEREKKNHVCSGVKLLS